MSPVGDVADAALQVEQRGAFWFLRLNRPDKRNALNEPMLEALDDACGRIEADDRAHGVVLWGAGGHFSAGADIGRFQQLQAGTAGTAHDPVVAHNRAFGRMLERLAALPVPTLGVVRGSCMGGGCGLVATLDRVIAAQDAAFAMPEVTLGIAPAQIAPLVARRIGATRARWLMLGGVRLDAAAARDAGLADVVVPIDDLAATVAAELALLARADPAALRATKRLVALSLAQPLGTTLDAAAREFAALLRAPAAAEAMVAMRERRAPAWAAEVPALPEFT